MRRRHPHNLRCRHRGGVAFVYAIIVFVVMVAFCSLAVDYGMVQLVKTELQRGADASVRAAAAAFTTGGVSGAQTAATTYATANTTSGMPTGVAAIPFDSSQDVEFGTWNSANETFTVLSGAARSNANAIRVWCRRTSARGTAVPLGFAKLVGRSTCDVSASAIAVAPTQTNTTGPGFVGLNAFATSDITTDSYDGSAGNYASQAKGSKGSIISNADIYAWNCDIKGDARPGVGDGVWGGNISGSRTPLTSNLSYTTPTFPASNNNSNISINGGGIYSGDLNVYGTATLPGGTYVFSNIYCSGTLNFTGPASVYVTGQVSLSGTINTHQNKPANLLLVVNNGLYLYPQAPLYADIFSPQSMLAYTPGGSPHFYGQIIVEQWYVYNLNLHFDTSLPSHNPSGGGFTSGGGGSSSGKPTMVR